MYINPIIETFNKILYNVGMKNLLCILLFFLTFCPPAFSETIKTGIEYSTENAKKIPVSGIPKRLPKNLVKSNLIDPFFDENKALIEQNILEIEDRIIDYFDSGNYAITYKSDLYTGFYYNSIGQLYGISIKSEIKDNPPYLFYDYDINGKLVHVVFFAREQEYYGFDAKGNKIENYLYGQFYTKDGIPIKSP